MTRIEPHVARHAAAASRGTAGIARAGVAVAAAGALVNVLGYVVPFFGARRLTPADLSVLATVLGLGAIASVTALGLQTAIAVRWARVGPVPRLGRTTALTAGLTGLVLALASPLAALALHMSVVPPLLMAATIVAVVMASRSLGELQGAQRFRSLGAAMVVAGLARYGGVVIGLLAGAGVDASLALGAVVAWVAVPALAALAGRPSHVDGQAGQLQVREIVAAGSATLATLAISYADLVLARGLLPAAESGAYAVGAVLTKGALWAPQVVTVLALPQLAKGRRGALRVAVGLVALCGAVLVVGAGLFGSFAIRLAGGPTYAHLGPYAGRFAAVGALYAVVFVLVNAEIAARVRRPATPLWFALIGLGLLARFVVPHTVGGILTASLITASVTFVAMAVMARSRWRA
jgi:O-antigen/teichoic acid export membrane protein